MGRHPVIAAIGLALACSGVVACAADESDTEVISIGVASAPSLSEAFNELIGEFEDAHPGVRVHLELGRSDDIAGTLDRRTDINVFAAASEDAMALAVERGAATDTQAFARNHVVVAVPTGNPGQIRGLSDLARPGLRVGLCAEPAPCGRAGMTLLSAAGVTPAAVNWESGSRALSARLADNELDAGIIYRTDVANSRGWVDDVEVSESERQLMRDVGATRYILARVPGGEVGSDAEEKRMAAAQFRELVTSDRGRQALADAGLDVGPG